MIVLLFDIVSSFICIIVFIVVSIIIIAITIIFVFVIVIFIWMPPYQPWQDIVLLVPLILGAAPSCSFFLS